MKKKQNSLLDKLKDEKKNIHKNTSIFSDIENHKIENNTELTIRIDEIKKLQEKATFESSNKIDQLLEVNFPYNYPFDFKILKFDLSSDKIYLENYKNTIDFKNLNKTDNLKNHIKRETNLNSLKNSYEETLEILNKINKFRHLHDKLDMGMLIGGCIFIIIIVNLFYPISGIISWFVLIILSIIGGSFIARLFRVHTDKIQKDIYNQLNKNLNSLKKNRAEIN